MLDVEVRNKILAKLAPERRHTILVVEDNEENCEILVHILEQKYVEHNIARQITQQGDLDYVTYRIVCKDGSVKQVRDYGRFVHTELYGNVYYVLIFAM